jgi:hypothetical protein
MIPHYFYIYNISLYDFNAIQTTGANIYIFTTETPYKFSSRTLLPPSLRTGKFTVECPCPEPFRQKGEPVSQARRARQLIKTRRVIEKALRARIQGEKRKEQWLDMRKRWEQGEFIQATHGDIMSFQKGPECCEGPYRQWVGYSDPWEISVSASDARVGLYPGGLQRRDSMGVSNGWDEGSEAWDSLQREQDKPTGVSLRVRVRAGRAQRAGERAYGPARRVGGISW